MSKQTPKKTPEKVDEREKHLTVMRWMLEYLTQPRKGEEMENTALDKIIQSILDYFGIIGADYVQTALYTQVVHHAFCRTLEVGGMLEKATLHILETLGRLLDDQDEVPNVIRQTKAQIIVQHLRDDHYDLKEFSESIHDVLDPDTDPDLLARFTTAAKNLNNKSVAAQAKNALLKQFDLQEYKKMMRNFLDRVAAKFEKPQLYDIVDKFYNSKHTNRTILSFQELESASGSRAKLQEIYNEDTTKTSGKTSKDFHEAIQKLRNDSHDLKYYHRWLPLIHSRKRGRDPLQDAEKSTKLRRQSTPVFSNAKERSRSPSPIRDDNLISLPKSPAKQNFPDVSTETNLVLAKRQKKFWSTEEEDLLLEAVAVSIDLSRCKGLRVKEKGVGKWKEIIKSFPFGDRTAVDLKDKFRNMMKKDNTSVEKRIQEYLRHKRIANELMESD